MKRMTVLAILLAGFGLHCGQKHVAWVTDFNPVGPGTYDLFDLEASGGNIYVAGSWARPGGDPRAVVAAYDETGALRWCWTDQARGVVRSAGHGADLFGRGTGLYLLLARHRGMTKTQGYALAFLDTAGRLVWDKPLAANPDDDFEAGRLVVDYNGNACVAAIGKTGRDSCYLMLATCRADGATLWSRSYPVPGSSWAGLELAATGDNYLVAGPTTEDTSLFLIRIDTSGRMAGMTIYRGATRQAIRLIDLSADDAGNVVLGSSIQEASSGQDFLTLLYDRRDSLLWSAQFDGGRNLDDITVGAVLDDSGSVFVTGNSVTAAGHTEITAIRYDCDGQEMWRSAVASRRSSEVHYCEEVDVCDGDDFGLAGTADGRLLVARINRTGAILSVQTFRVPGDRGDEMRVVRVRGDVFGIMWAGRGAVLKLGESRWSGQRWD